MNDAVKDPNDREKNGNFFHFYIYFFIVSVNVSYVTVYVRHCKKWSGLMRKKTL